jgi:hypothetical protein
MACFLLKEMERANKIWQFECLAFYYNIKILRLDIAFE